MKWATTLAVLGALASAVQAEIVEIQAARDTTLYEDAEGTIGNGSGAHLFVGLTGQPLRRRTLLWFDVPTHLPAGSTIVDAELILHMSQTSAPIANVHIHRLTADWGESTSDAAGGEGGGTLAVAGDATWLHRFHSDTLWGTAGGDFGGAISATAAVGQAGYYSWTSGQFAQDVQSMLDAPEGNFGWILIGNEGSSSSKRFDSRQNEDLGRRPVLRLEIVRPIPQVPTTGRTGMIVLVSCLLIGLAWNSRRRRSSK
jgi:hypothetical protein